MIMQKKTMAKNKKSILKIQVLVDNSKSWFNRYVKELMAELKKRKHHVSFLQDYKKVEKGDIFFVLSCNSIIPDQVLERNKYNLVVHAAPVPKGRGWSPMTWQILEGKNDIHVSLFEAVAKVDSGNVFGRGIIHLYGTELIDEWQELLGRKVNEMALAFVDSYPNIKAEKQTGESSYYRRRKPEDSELDINKSIAEQFNLLRVVNNEQYPAFFRHKGCKYVLTIRKEEDKKE
jgi:methionyl-tRNA formyltransferase